MPPTPAETKTAETMLDLIQSSGFGAEFRLIGPDPMDRWVRLVRVIESRCLTEFKRKVVARLGRIR